MQQIKVNKCTTYLDDMPRDSPIIKILEVIPRQVKLQMKAA